MAARRARRADDSPPGVARGVPPRERAESGTRDRADASAEGAGVDADTGPRSRSPGSGAGNLTVPRDDGEDVPVRASVTGLEHDEPREPGVEFVMESTAFGDLRIAFLTDPGGVRVVLIEHA
ncbi:hypothetical protein [Halorubrum kocurii]|uniref:Lyase/ dioxygenase n=1 Tax=Halorubrum kocurii JCM 14978 TaxID=1230456 RepID=M0P7Y1_9EURY|nr:hypothetical protein [Halorubrum kocurii]EMA66267.1 lyase/ dioxygenase [Halorubrum kocurii JCM 14978]